MIRVEYDRHDASGSELPRTDEPSQAGDFLIRGVAGEIAHDLPVPGLWSPAAHQGFEFGKLLFDARQAFFELYGGLGHRVIFPNPRRKTRLVSVSPVVSSVFHPWLRQAAAATL